MKSHSVCQSVLLCFTLAVLCMDVCICVCAHSVLSSLNLRDEMNTEQIMEMFISHFHNSNESITDL